MKKSYEMKKHHFANIILDLLPAKKTLQNFVNEIFVGIPSPLPGNVGDEYPRHLPRQARLLQLYREENRHNR